ncbi:MAG: uroporphyrinogen-III C-methyltransferase [Propionivibrio sp.]
MNDAPDPSPAPSETVAASAPASGSVLHSWRNPWLILAILALGVAVWQWAETRVRLAETQRQVAHRLAESDTLARETRVIVKETQKQVIALQGKFGELEAKLAESQDQQDTLEKLYRDLAGNRDEWVLAEIEQGVTLAAQQLQLAANAQGAVLALQSAEIRLAGSKNPQFAALHKVIQRDLDRLRALPQVNLAGMNGRLESVIAAVDSLPLAVERPAARGEQAACAVRIRYGAGRFARLLAARGGGFLA